MGSRADHGMDACYKTAGACVAQRSSCDNLYAIILAGQRLKVLKGIWAAQRKEERGALRGLPQEDIATSRVAQRSSFMVS